jgi:hypothetical protein
MKDYIDEAMVAEQHFEHAMQLVEDNDWKALAEYLRFTDDATAEAVRLSLNADDTHSLQEAEKEAPHDSYADEVNPFTLEGAAKIIGQASKRIHGINPYEN